MMSLSTTLLVAVGAFLLVLRVIAKQTTGSVVTVRGLALIPAILLAVGLVSTRDVLAAASTRD
ncbi:hypothetical protein ACFQ1S_36875, partial [Kibdelosporangium lantanae]